MERINLENIGNWTLDPKANVSVGDFNNTSDKALCIFPGQYEGDGIFEVDNPDKKPLFITDLCENDYDYFYKGDGYFYGITKENQGFSLKGTKIDQWVKVGTGIQKSDHQCDDRIFAYISRFTAVEQTPLLRFICKFFRTTRTFYSKPIDNNVVRGYNSISTNRGGTKRPPSR